MPGGVARIARIIIRRAAHDWVMLSAAVVTVLVATTLLAAGPIYADAIGVGSLQRTMAEADARAANVAISLRRPPENYAALDRLVTDEVTRTFDTTGQKTYRIVEAEAHEIDSDAGGPTSLAIFRWMEGIEDFTTLESGAWPDPAAPGLEVAVHAGAADLLDLEVGDRFVASNRRDRSIAQTAVVVGVFSVDDLFDPYWLGEDLVGTGVSESPNFRSFGPFILTRDRLLADAVAIQADFEWRAFPDFSTLTPAAIPRLGRDLAGLQDRLDGALEDRLAIVGALATVFDVDSDLSNLLSRTARSLTVTQSGILMLTAQLGILAAYALVLTAGLMVDSRRTETELLRSRGAGNTQLLMTGLGEGVLITVPAALLAPWLAARVLDALDGFGPFREAGLELVPRITPSSYLIALVAAVGCTLALAIPSYRAARSFSSAEAMHRREHRRGGLQRLGIDLALLALAAFAFWQLRTYGAQIASRTGLGIDPLLVAAPALGILAGGTLALRSVPFISWVAERAAARGKATVAALAAWQVSRRPRRYARSALLLVMAIAIGLFAAAYTTTWSRSQADRADFEAGADIRVAPDRRLNLSVPDLQLSDAHERLAAVEESMPVVRQTGRLANSNGTLSRFVMLDARRAADIVNVRGDLVTTDFGELMQRLAAGRPALGAVQFPGAPRRLSLVVEATVEDFPPDFPSEFQDRNAIRPALRVVLQDGDGLLHRVAVGEIPVDGRATRLSAPLTHAELGIEEFAPIYPLKLVDIEIMSLTPPDLSRIVEVEFSELAVSSTSEGDDWADLEIDGSAWDVASFANGRVTTAPAIAAARSAEPTQGLRVTIESGSGGRPMPVPVHYGIRPTGPDLPPSFPVVVTEGFVAATSTGVGEDIVLGLAGSQNDRATIMGTMVGFPTVDPAQAEAVLIDLASFQMMNYRVGAPIVRPNEYWLDTSGADENTAAQLAAAPYFSPGVTDRVDRAEVLRTDPIALGAIASLSLGFVAATVFAAIGFAVSATVSARERVTEFALLRALGLSNRQLGRWLVLEQGALVAVSLVLGTLVGIVLATMILPVISLTQTGVSAVPTPEVIVPASTIAGLELAVVATLLVVVAVLAVALRRLGVGSLLRLGGD